MAWFRDVILFSASQICMRDLISSMRSQIASVIGVPARSKSCTSWKCARLSASKEIHSGLYLSVGMVIDGLLVGGSTTRVGAVWVDMIGNSLPPPGGH
jgi:hypothetical protein